MFPALLCSDLESEIELAIAKLSGKLGPNQYCNGAWDRLEGQDSIDQSINQAKMPRQYNCCVPGCTNSHNCSAADSVSTYSSIFWKKSAHRLRKTFHFAESFDAKGAFEMRHWFPYFFSLIRISEFLYTNFSSTCVRGVCTITAGRRGLGLEPACTFPLLVL